MKKFSSILGIILRRFLIHFRGGYINFVYYPPENESKIGVKEPQNRLKLFSTTVSKWTLLKELNLPLSEYLIIGSGPLEIRNLRKAQDIDLLVSQSLWDELGKKYPIVEDLRGKRIVFPGKKIEAFLEGSPHFERGRIAQAEWIDGLPFDPLKQVVSFKKRMGRPKDFEDLLLIQTFLHAKSLQKKLFADFIQTPLGPMLAVGDEKALYLLEFLEKKNLSDEWEFLEKQTNSVILLNSSQPIDSIRSELELYFSGVLQAFKTPLFPIGSPFQLTVWQELQKIPYGQTCSYGEIAKRIGKPSACRAVAQANGANTLAIIIPCHRVIETSGALGGYSGGVFRKEQLLRLERS